MPDDQPDLEHVRDALREHDAQPEPRMSHGPTDLEDGVTVIALDRDGEERFQPLRRSLGVSSFGMNLVRLRPRQRGRIHRHERQEEVYLVLEGTLTLELEGEASELVAGQLARVAPGIRRRLANRGDALLLVLALGGAGAHEGRDGRAFTDWDDHEGGAPQEIPLPPDLPEP